MFCLMPTFAAICDEILLPLQHQGEVAHSYTELHDASLIITAVHGFMVLTHTDEVKRHISIEDHM